jgi:hypothetical protein
VPNPEEKPFVDHLNGLRMDNRAFNLVWASSAHQILEDGRLVEWRPIVGFPDYKVPSSGLIEGVFGDILTPRALSSRGGGRGPTAGSAANEATESSAGPAVTAATAEGAESNGGAAGAAGELSLSLASPNLAGAAADIGGLAALVLSDEEVDGLLRGCWGQ